MESKAGLRIPYRLMVDLERQAVAAYPEECCGALLGGGDNADASALRQVHSLWPAANVHSGRRSERYAIATEELLRLHIRAREKGEEVLGYYHSHPDGGAEPSARDLAAAHTGISYLIVAVRGNEVVERRSWRMRSDRQGFAEERLILGSET